MHSLIFSSPILTEVAVDEVTQLAAIEIDFVLYHLSKLTLQLGTAELTLYHFPWPIRDAYLLLSKGGFEKRFMRTVPVV